MAEQPLPESRACRGARDAVSLAETPARRESVVRLGQHGSREGVASAELRPRDLAVLRVLAENRKLPLHAGDVWRLACPDEPRRGRRDAGMTRTLDRLERLGLVRGRYEWESTSRYWSITDAGREALGGG